ncbi:NAD(P)-dependent oxidoreductase [Legionella sp. km772]|uniref:NAD(P)-dependent oxidoreductase n=1 Tax=Legionella sp. km772 TaxID=2498111 RepID=UPI000F8CF896|nr:NAD(P)-dependent oxidoreductase [Legionella sp. km772]RUR04941.1 4-phosphoerythronate dehydrogenase [Legionella sp. km772]
MKILADASLPGLHEAFPPPFHLSLYANQKELENLLPAQDILLCRANLQVNKRLLMSHKLSVVATASSGSDNLDLSYLKSQNILSLNAKGCNATSVADYVISCLALLDKMNRIKGLKLGVIGHGHVGSTLVPRLRAAGFDIYCYDPLKALMHPSFKTCTLEQLYRCDVLCIHAELHESHPHPSYNLIDNIFLEQLQPHCIIINASRGGIVNEEALLSSSVQYCSDVYLNEPRIDRKIIDRAILCTPHIAGHSLEAKYAAVAIISKKIHSLLGIPLPEYLYPPQATPLNEAQASWQELALLLYNPWDETQQLKQATDLESVFLALRQAHKKRHDFYTYFNQTLNPQIKPIFF